MRSPLIAVTAGEVHNQVEPWSPTTHGQSYTYIDAIIHAGGTPFIVPLVENEATQRQLYDMADGILFAGGNDPDPALYGQLPYPETVDVSVKRDQLELQFMDWAFKERKPLLGICRGMQLMNIQLNGTLYQDIPTDLPDADDHNSSTKQKSLVHKAHLLNVSDGTQLAAILGTLHPETNSHHHQAIKKLAARLTVNALSEDGLIEGVEYTGDSFAIGVQGHPESLEAHAVPVWKNLFSALVQEAIIYHKAQTQRQLEYSGKAIE
jgi:putative glutamine amidotransferase